MEIKAGKNGEFIIKYEDGTIAIDPNQDKDYTITMLTAKDNNSKGENLVLDWPGEYEASNVLCTSIQVLENDIEYRIINLEVDGFKMVFFGNNPKLIPEKVLKSLSNVEILALPLNMGVKDMQVLVEEIEPAITLIAKDDSYKDEEGNLKFEKYLKILGQENIESSDSLKIKSKEELETINNFIALNV